MRTRRLSVVGALAISGLLAFASSAPADHHLVKVREVHNGAAIANDYVMIQMYEPGQNLLGGHYLRFFDAAGGVLAEYPLTNVPNGESQRTYLLGNNVTGADSNQGGVNVAGPGEPSASTRRTSMSAASTASAGATTPA